MYVDDIPLAKKKDRLLKGNRKVTMIATQPEIMIRGKDLRILQLILVVLVFLLTISKSGCRSCKLSK